MANGDILGMFTSLGNTADSTATVYRGSDLGGLEICQRRLAEHTGARGYIIVTERFVFGRFICVVGRFRSIIIKKYFGHHAYFQLSKKGREVCGSLCKYKRKTSLWNQNELATYGSILITPYQTLYRRIAFGIEETFTVITEEELNKQFLK